MPATFPDWIERQSLVARNQKVVFVPTLKAGCTSVMWALAEIEGTLAPPEDISELADQSLDQIIHNPRIHGLPSLASFDGAVRREMLGGSEWTRFCVTRDPYARLLSAWLNRAFLYSTGAEEFFVPPDPDLRSALDGDLPVDVGARFRSFVRRLVAPTDDPGRSHVDPHFATQFSLIRPDVFPYTDVVPLGQLGRFAAGLGPPGRGTSGLVPVVRNVSLDLRPDDVFDAATAALVEVHYIDDFGRLGYATRSFPSKARPLIFSAREMALVRMLHERSDRLRQLASIKNPPRPVRDGARRVRRVLGRGVRRRR